MELDLMDRFKWGCYFMQERLGARCSVMHQKIARLPGLFKKLFCFGFRLGAKTTWGSELTALYEATEAPVGFIRISSNTALLAEDILYRITKELKQNRFLLEVYPWLTAKWEEENKDEIILPNGTMIQARGFMSIKMGPHPDREIIDDPHHPVEVKSDIIRQNFYQQWKSVSGSWKPALPGQAETAVLYIANFLHPLDPSVKFHENALVNEMGIDLSDWERIKFESGYHKKAPIWPEVWSMEKLEAKRRAMGWQQFDAEFENKPEFFLEPPIKPGWFKTYKPEQILRQDLASAAMWITYDAAFSIKQMADFWAAGLWAKFFKGSLKGKTVLLKHVNNKALLDDNVRGMLGWVQEFHGRPAIVHFRREGKDFIIVKQTADRLMQQERMNCSQPEVEREDFPGDKRQRMMAVSGEFQAGNVLFPEQGSQPIIEQILMLGEGDHDDYADIVSDGVYFGRTISDPMPEVSNKPALSYLSMSREGAELTPDNYTVGPPL